MLKVLLLLSVVFCVGCQSVPKNEYTFIFDGTGKADIYIASKLDYMVKKENVKLPRQYVVKCDDWLSGSIICQETDVMSIELYKNGVFVSKTDGYPGMFYTVVEVK
jgi:hypothetical protein